MTSETLSAQTFATALASTIHAKAEKADDMLRGWTIEARIGGVYGFLRFNDNPAKGGIDFRCEVDEVEVFGTITKADTRYVWEVESLKANNCHPSFPWLSLDASNRPLCHPSTLRIVAAFVEKISLASRGC
jgi:hypothetical protein